MASIFEIIRTKPFDVIIFFLIKNPDQINIRDENGQTALLAAVSCGKLKIAEILLNDYGADINAVNIAQQTALDIAIDNNDAAMISLLETRIQLNNFIAQNNGDKNQALISAVKMGNKKFISHLVAQKANPNTKDSDGKTAFMHAVALGKIEEATTFFSSNVIDNKDNNGNTAFMTAIAGTNREMMAFLLQKKANTEATNNAEQNALMAIENEEKRAEIANFIKDQELRSSLFSFDKIHRTFLAKDLKSKVTHTYDAQSPKFGTGLILAEYYKLKYGIKIAVFEEDFGYDEVINFVNNKTDADFQFGVILYGTIHNTGNVFEKFGDKKSLVSLDSSPPCGKDWFYSDAMEKIPNLNLFCPDKNNELQVSGRCATHAISMTKDALKLESVTQEFERKATIINAENGLITYSKLPPKLLKYAETARSVQGVDKKEAILRSSVKKPQISLSDYRAQNSKTEVIIKDGREELRPERNFRIFDKGIEFFDKVKRVLEFYEVDESRLYDFTLRLEESQKESLNDGTFANLITTQLELNQQTKVHTDYLNIAAKDIPSWSKLKTPQEKPRATFACPLSKQQELLK